MNLFTKQEQTHRERIYGYQGNGEGGIDWEFGIDIYTLLFLKQKITDFPSSQVVKALCFQCRGHEFDPWSKELRSSVVEPKIYIYNNKNKK